MANRIQVLLDYPFPALYGEGWGMSKLAGALKFAKWTTQLISGSGGGTFATQVLEPAAPPAEFWKVPGLGVITRAPRFFKNGILDYDDPASDVYRDTEADIATNDDGGSSLRLLAKTGTMARTRTGSASTLIGLLADIAILAILAEMSNQLKTIWRTKNALLANEGWAVQIIPVRVPDDPRSRSYVALTFGSKFALGIDLQGTAQLHENLGTSTDPIWVQRKSFDVGNSVDLTKNFVVTCIPIGGRYIVFRFGNVRFRAQGFRLEQYIEQRDFVYDTYLEGSGSYYDAGIDQYVQLPPGKLGIAVNASGVDYRFGVHKLRYDTTNATAYFTGEPLPNILPGQTPTVNAYGYASNTGDADPEQRTGAGTMSTGFKNENNATWDDDSLMVCPSVTMAGSPNGVWTPELWYLEARIDPRIEIPDYTPYDASEEWTYIRFQRTTAMEPAGCTLKLKSESRYAQLFRRGGPVRILVDGVPVFDGYLKQRRDTITNQFVNGEYEGRDMWSRMNVPCGHFESQDGKQLSDLFYRLIRRAGFLPENIVIGDSNLLGAKVENFSEAQTLKLFNWGTKVGEGIKDLAERYSVQGSDGIRVRQVGGDWLVYFAPYGYDPTAEDPALTFYSFAEAAPYSDAERWDAGLLKITSGIEKDETNPAFNSLECALATSGGEGASSTVAFIPPPPPTLDDPTSQLFEGLLNPEQRSAPEITATTKDELTRQTRFIYDAEQRKILGIGFQAEWQPFVDCDQECVVLGKNPDGYIVSYGVYRIEPFDVEISQDEGESEETGVYLRSYEWSSAYTLRYLRPTKESYPYPMFSEFIPPKGFFTV